MSVDVVVCTKNRHRLLAELVNQINLFSYNRLVVVDGSEVPYVLESNGKDFVVHVPCARLGAARQIGLERCDSKYVFFVDDDTILTPSCLHILYDALDHSGDARLVAVSGKVIYGNNDVVFRKLFSRTKAFGEGETGGFVLLKRKEVLLLGGFNSNIHWGEDVELRQRMNAKGLRWGRVPEAIAYHPWSFSKALRDMRRHGGGCRSAVNVNGGFFGMATRLVGRVFFMPLFYGLQTCDPRVFGYYSVMNLCLLYGFLCKTKT